MVAALLTLLVTAVVADLLREVGSSCVLGVRLIPPIRSGVEEHIVMLLDGCSRSFFLLQV